MKSGETPQNSRIEKTLETIREQADFMNKIVSDLQDYARQPKPSFVEYDLKGLIDDTLSSITIPKTVEVSSSFDPDFPKLTVDPNLLRRHQSLKQRWRGNNLYSRNTNRPKKMIPIMERKSILIVDDDPGILNSFKEILEPEGYNVDTAQTGSEALEKCKARLYNIE